MTEPKSLCEVFQRTAAAHAGAVGRVAGGDGDAMAADRPARLYLDGL